MEQKVDPQFVFDGNKRARMAAIEKIRARIEAEYCERLQAASWVRRWLLKLEMRREITRQLDRIAPPDALYLRGSSRR